MSLEATLRETLQTLLTGEDGAFAIVVADRPSNVYVQFAHHGVGLLAECVSNAYLEPMAQQTEAAEDQLRVLGWDVHPGENHSREYAAPVDAAAVAADAARALTEVYRIPADAVPEVELQLEG